MLALSVVWLIEGLIVGALATGARLGPDLWERFGNTRMIAIGALAGLAGGWLGTLVYGRYFGIPTALWVAVVAVFSVRFGPRLVSWTRKRLASRTPAAHQ